MTLFVMALIASSHLTKDAYGVTRISASTFEETLFEMGRVVAEDRLWQMEMSRRIATGRSAEVLGSTAVASDKETLRLGYSDEEYAAMFAQLSPKAQSAFINYAKGVNDVIERRKSSHSLGTSFESAGVLPEPWTTRDSMAIAVMLARRFGTGGAGELRNLALALYLQTQPCKDRYLDVVDDFAWQNDKRSIPTVSDSDDPIKSKHPVFPNPTRQETVAHLKSLPKVGLLELVPAIRASNYEDSRLIAEKSSVAFETGSYCIVVSPKKSTTGRAILLSGPQMGFTMPSVVHEIALDGPGIRVAGIDVPGIPAVVIGKTPNLAWGLTTGVADLADIYAVNRPKSDVADVDGEQLSVTRKKLTIKVRGGTDQMVERVRVMDQPVVLESSSTKSLFVQKSSYWKKEVQSWCSLYDLYNVKTTPEIDKAVDQIAMNMNFFFATTKGETGWRYVGWVPQRRLGIDPRFPILETKANDWKGMIPRSLMPRVNNPNTGLIANWNNKPVSWWPNLDTPAWGSIFRNEVLLRSLQKPKLSVWDVERAPWEIARKDADTNSRFLNLLKSCAPQTQIIQDVDEWSTQGNPGATVARDAVRNLKQAIFEPVVGNFTNPSFFDQIVQPSVLFNAVNRKTKYDYLGTRSLSELAKQALEQAILNLTTKFGPESMLWPNATGSIRYEGQTPIPYSNRGTYIQIIDLQSPPVGRSVCGPGAGESGEHSADQIDLMRQWTYKPMWSLGVD